MHDRIDRTLTCLVCQEAALLKVEGFDLLPRITSDCRTFSPGGELYVCDGCSAVQKQPSPAWRREINEIYSSYASYYQSGGDEQIVFDRVSGQPRRRSDVILERLVAGETWSAGGSALDVGCGNGATLSSMSRVLAEWRLNGFEIGEESLARLNEIPRFDRLFSKSLDLINASFDLVTMIHSLEHFPSPATALANLLPIVGKGKLFIEVCNIDENPFDILIADHLMHFSPATLALLMRRMGYVPVTVATDWVPKEISMLAKAGNLAEHPDSRQHAGQSPSGELTFSRVCQYVRWLRGMAESVRNCCRGQGPVGIFGTSIAATWLAVQLRDRITFFVDEDRSRVGKQHLGCPILDPASVPAGSTVYLALAPGIAGIIANRLAHLDFTVVLPPVMEMG